MRDQPPPVRRPRREPARAEHHVAAHGIGLGVEVARRLLGRGARMHPHPREVAPEARLEIGARGRIERLPRRAEHVLHDGRRRAGGGWRRGGDIRGRHAHHLVRDAVRRPLEAVARRCHPELRLDQPPDRPVADAPLQRDQRRGRGLCRGPGVVVATARARAACCAGRLMKPHRIALAASQVHRQSLDRTLAKSPLRSDLAGA